MQHQDERPREKITIAQVRYLLNMGCFKRNTVELLYCIMFTCTVKWFSYMYLFRIFFIIDYYKILDIVLCAIKYCETIQYYSPHKESGKCKVSWKEEKNEQGHMQDALDIGIIRGL